MPLLVDGNWLLAGAGDLRVQGSDRWTVLEAERWCAPSETQRVADVADAHLPLRAVRLRPARYDV